MTLRNLRQRFALFDPTGLSKDAVRSLYLLIWAVAMGTVCFNVTGGIAMTTYLRALGADDFQYGIIMGIAPFLAAVQLLASYILERTYKRRAMFLVAGIIQRVLWLPFGLVPYFVPMSMPLMRVWSAGVLLGCTSLMNPFVNVAFYSLVSDLVPMRIRGRYFGVRSRISTCVGLLGGFVTAAMLDRLPGMPGYAVVFAMAAVFGTADIVSFFWVKFPEMERTPDKPNIFRMLGEVLRNRQFLRVILFFTIWTFGVQISGPFYNVYASEVMGMSKVDITLYAQIAASAMSILVVARWGRALDEYGSRPVVRLAAVVASFLPFLWMFTKQNVIGMVVVINLISGGVWCAIELGAQNLFLGQSPQRNRSMYVAAYFVITQLIGVGAANAFGGWMLKYVFAGIDGLGLSVMGFPFTRYHALFVLSGVMRLGAALLFFGKLPEENARSPRDVLNGMAGAIITKWTIVTRVAKLRRAQRRAQN